VDVAVEIPENFSRVLLDYKEGKKVPPALVRTYGEPSNLSYMMAVVWCDALTYQYTADFTGHAGPLELKAEAVSNRKALTEFDLYVPGLLVLALICLMFTAAATLIKEKDKGTIIRLRMSNMTVTQWLSAVSLAQVIIGMAALALTYLTILSLGYKTSGSLLAASVIGILSSLAIMAVSLLMAAFLRTIFDLMTVGCFPFFILMFFSGGMMPLPSLPIFEMAGRSINANEILPTTHSIKALGKILNGEAGLGDVGFEIAAIVVLTIVYFAAGLWLFRKKHLTAQ
jgi:ABC-2 type transport system permease protein